MQYHVLVSASHDQMQRGKQSRTALPYETSGKGRLSPPAATGPLGDRGSGKVIFQSSRRRRCCRRSPFLPSFPSFRIESGRFAAELFLCPRDKTCVASCFFFFFCSFFLSISLGRGPQRRRRRQRRRCEREINGEIWPRGGWGHRGKTRVAF